MCAVAAFVNPDHSKRLVVIPQVSEAFGDLYFGIQPEGSTPVDIIGLERPIPGFQVKESVGDAITRSIFNMPFLFHRCGEPWIEANSFLIDLVRNKHAHNRPTDEAKRKASRLLDYLIFTEENNINWLDFSGKRITLRPTYRYHAHLMEKKGRGPAVCNQYTGVVYQFYKFVSRYWHSIDINRVDTVKQISMFIDGAHGFTRQITVEQRSQTQRYNKTKVVPAGFVDDEGECLRPLSNSELASVVSIVNSDGWDAQERLIVLFALMTGARKQTVLTLRVKHVEALIKGMLEPEGTYILKAGPGTGIDTKNDKPQTLHVPKDLVEDLLTYVQSAYAKSRRQRFLQRYAVGFPDLEAIPKGEEYVFLSERANCYYMAASDPRYPFVKTRPLGAVADTIKKKLMRSVPADFPKDFTYHWLRATFAYQLYQLLVPRLENRSLLPGEEISIIQERLHHERRETTEGYLKLFTMIPEKVRAQESYEDALFKMSSYRHLILVNRDAN
ncbi:integrase [Pseudomonas frederiksbergensis]|uniref:Integrase n=1 Tax=Pseudomonas frederiksbergensis TaxID=104087 RepID=A0A423KNH5_9PSED|nr:site-specific integrase [Pseudomonas frederiksbergensis]RON55923.1 integrase [Pseudomonas frederiksbergensis]